ncbi:hypothetical protein [Gloeothece verrucosa]|uniref:Uncharacterized protein n=1 Tax=Gloeothece verrucosa (strain PCC 7822) TaxID=497965 RepID=E0UMD8_GLOV7|nr:hypothetical protein [Gloeothece verrucosa]ADN18118.1 hypothetical protein Cyan7822_6323 [Gloeothece verrucosa PCC 7822]
MTTISQNIEPVIVPFDVINQLTRQLRAAGAKLSVTSTEDGNRIISFRKITPLAEKLLQEYRIPVIPEYVEQGIVVEKIPQVAPEVAELLDIPSLALDEQVQMEELVEVESNLQGKPKFTEQQLQEKTKEELLIIGQNLGITCKKSQTKSAIIKKILN